MTAGVKALAALAVLALLASLVPPAARLMWHLDGHTAVMPAPVGPQRAAPPEAAAVSTDAILALAPFGAPDRPAAAAPAQTARTLDIALRGVLVASDAAESRALVQVGQRLAMFRIGDDLAEAAVLVEILPEAIAVEVDGARRLYGFDGALGDDAAGPAATAAAPDAPSALERIRAMLVPGRGSLDLREAPPPETTAEYIDLWRERITANPQDVLDTIGLVPGEGGYTIAKNPNVGVTLAGLRPGDVVTRVNGQEVGNPDEDRAFYDEVAASGQARLEVVRGGETLLMSFPLR